MRHGFTPQVPPTPSTNLLLGIAAVSTIITPNKGTKAPVLRVMETPGCLTKLFSGKLDPFSLGPSNRWAAPGEEDHLAMCQKPNCSPSEHPNPTTKIGFKMSGAPNTVKWNPIGFDPRPFHDSQSLAEVCIERAKGPLLPKGVAESIDILSQGPFGQLFFLGIGTRELSHLSKQARAVLCLKCHTLTPSPRLSAVFERTLLFLRPGACPILGVLGFRRDKTWAMP